MRFATLGVIGCALAAGCPCGNPPPVSCDSSRPCPDGQTCVEGTCQAPVAFGIKTASLPDSNVNVAYSARVEAEGGTSPYAFVLAGGAGLPAGLTLAPDGLISGTPVQAGSATFTVQASDSSSPAQVASKSFTLLVNPTSGTALQITTASLPGGTVGAAYTATLQATGGITPYAWSLASGTSLPSGLTLSASGTLGGTPNTAGTSTFTVQVSDASSPQQLATRQLSIAIAGVGSTLAITTTSLPNASVGQPYAATLTATGGTTPYSFSVSAGNLPAGLTLAASGAISGTPSQAGTLAFTVQCTDSSSPAQLATQALSITVQGATGLPLRITTTALPNGTVGQAYSDQLAATGGTTPYTWSLDAASTFPPGLSLSPTGVISGTPSTAGQYDFTVVVADSSSPRQTASAALTLTVIAPGSTLAVTTANLPNGVVGAAYSQPLAASGGTAPYTWSVAAGALPPGLTLSTAGLISGTPTTAGAFAFTVQVADASTPQQTAQASLSITVNPNPAQSLAITTGALPNATVGTAYNHPLAAAGGTTPYTWSVAAGALPNGLSLSTAGLISGTPTAAGSFTFSVRVVDASTPQQSAQKQFTITIVSNPQTSLTIQTQTLPGGMVGAAYTATILVSGGTTPYTFSVSAGALPAGLTFGAASGTISGTPTAAGSYTFTIRVVDSSNPQQSAERSYALTIRPSGGALIITTTSLPAATLNTAYSYTLTATGGTTPYTWTQSGGALPPGLNLASTGTLSGTPTSRGNFSFTAQVADSSNPPQTASRQFSLRVQ